MSDHSDAVWDEFQWEQFLQQQEKRTERYMELLEKYMDHPQRDEIIAREMNWTHLQEEQGREWEEEVDALFEQDQEDEEGEEAEPEASYPFESHPLYRQAIEFTAELGKIFDEETDQKIQEHPASNALQTGATVTAAKLAAALSDGEEGIDDLGMCIAYLKRALHAIHGCLSAVTQLNAAEIFDAERTGRIRGMLFAIRDGIVIKTGECRAEFRRRHGR
jgi:hypothetical protein